MESVALMLPVIVTTTIEKLLCFFFFNDTATTEIYTLSLHDALPIYLGRDRAFGRRADRRNLRLCGRLRRCVVDRKSTRLNSSHSQISYAVFCLKKKKYKHHHDEERHSHPLQVLGQVPPTRIQPRIAS